MRCKRPSLNICVNGPLAQSAERGADNAAKVMSSLLCGLLSSCFIKINLRTLIV